MKTKKLLSIILAMVLLVGCIGLQVSAADTTATISLVGEKQAIVGAEYEVVLNVKETSADLVGGISADVMYDSAKFELKRVEISSDFATANSINEATNTINTTTPGKIDVVLLDAPGDDNANDWLTFVFTVKDGQETTAEFKLENVNISDATGSKLITNNLTVDITENNIYAHMIDVNGASIRKDGVGNIRFEAEIDASVDRSKIKEIGFLMIPAVCLKDGLYNGDLTFTDDGKYTTADGRTVTIASNFKEISKIDKNETKVYCYLTNTTSYKLTTSFAARAYIKIDDGSEDGLIIYSDNQTYITDSKTYVKNIKGGTSSKSCIETAKAIYNLYKDKENVVFSDEFETIIAKNSWDNTEYEKIVAELANVDDSFN